MLRNINDFFSSIQDKKVAFIGMGVTNFSSIRLFLSKGINVTVLDKDISQLDSKEGRILSEEGADFIVGEDYINHLNRFDIVIRSPGVYFNSEKIKRAIKDGVFVTSELELFFQFCPCKIIGVTGSDGKTTTTTLIYEFLKKEGKNVYLGGNIGIPILPIIEEIQKDDVVVLELSSFQLISIRYSPDIAVVTNIAPNHLDVHGDMNEYVGAKLNILLHQNAFSKVILNSDCAGLSEFERIARGEIVKFSRLDEVETGAYFDESKDCYYYSNRGIKTKIMEQKDVSLVGAHNIENYLAAISAVYDIVNIDSIRFVSKNFKGVKHRIEFVCERCGVKWYNDSIATSPTRTIAGLKSFNKKIILIAGGYDKKLDYSPLAPYIINNVKSLILLGNTASKISDAVISFDKYAKDNPSIHFVGSLENAVLLANQIAVPGDIVSLSPASASFDCYKNFEQRGEHFKSIVLALKN